MYYLAIIQPVMSQTFLGTLVSKTREQRTRMKIDTFSEFLEECFSQKWVDLKGLLALWS